MQEVHIVDDAGISSAGSTSFLIDRSKNWSDDIWKDGLLHVTSAGAEYITIPTGNSQNQINFPALPAAVEPGSPYWLRWK